MVYNLLSNALKYHPSRPPRVCLSCAREGNWLCLRVQDTGLGLTAAQQAKLFGLLSGREAQTGAETTFTVSFPV